MSTVPQAQTATQLLQTADQMTRATIASAQRVEIVSYRVRIHVNRNGRVGYRNARVVRRYDVKADGVVVGQSLTKDKAERLAGRKYVDPRMQAPYLCETVYCFSAEGVQRHMVQAEQLGGKLYRLSTLRSSGEYRIIAAPSSNFQAGMARYPLQSIPTNLVEITDAEEGFNLQSEETR